MQSNNNTNNSNMQQHNEGERKTIGLELVASPELLSANAAGTNDKKKWSPGRKKKGSLQSSNKAVNNIETSSTSPMKNKLRRLSSGGGSGSPLAKSHVKDSAYVSLSSIQQQAPTTNEQQSSTLPSSTAKKVEEEKKTNTSSTTIKLQKSAKDTPTQKNRRLQLLRTVKSKKKSKSTTSSKQLQTNDDGAVIVNEDEMIGPLDEVLANRYQEKNEGKKGKRSASPTSMNSNMGYEIPFTSSDTAGNLKINSIKKASTRLRTLQDPAIVRDRSTLANRRSQGRKMLSSSQGRLGAIPRSSNALSSSPLLDPTMSDYFCTPTVSSSNIHDITTLPPSLPAAGGVISSQTTPERQVSNSSTQATPDNNTQGTPDDKLQSQINNDSPTGVNEIEQVLEAPTPITSNETNPSSGDRTISAEKSNEKKATNRQHKSFVELDEESNKQRLMLLTKNTSRLLAQGDEVKASLYISDMKSGSKDNKIGSMKENDASTPAIYNKKKKTEPLLPTTGIDLVDEMTKVFVDCLIGSNDAHNIVGYDDETETNMDESTAIDTAVDDDDSTVPPPERQEELPKPRELFNETKQYQDTKNDTAAVIAEVTDTPMFDPSWEQLSVNKEAVKKVKDETPDTSRESQEGVGIEDLFKRNKFDSPLRDDVDENKTPDAHELQSSTVCENTTSFTLNDDTDHLKEKKDDDVDSNVSSDISSKVAPPAILRNLEPGKSLFNERQNTASVSADKKDELNEDDDDGLQPLPSFDNSTVDDDLTLDSSLQSSLTSTRDESLLTPMTNHSDSEYNPIPSWFEDVVDKIGDAVGIDNQCGEIHSDDEYSDTEYPMDEDRSPRRRHRQRKNRSSRQSKSLHQRSRDLHRRRQQRKSRRDDVLNRVRSSSPSASLHRRTDSERDYLVSFSPGTIPELEQGHDNMADDDSYGEVHKLSQAPAVVERVQTSPNEGRTSTNRVDRLSRSFGHGKVNRLVRQWSAKSEDVM